MIQLFWFVLVILVTVCCSVMAFDPYEENNHFNDLYQVKFNFPSLVTKQNMSKLDAVILTTGKDIRAFERGLISALKYLVDVETFYIVAPKAQELQENMKKKWNTLLESQLEHYELTNCCPACLQCANLQQLHSCATLGRLGQANVTKYCHEFNDRDNRVKFVDEKIFQITFENVADVMLNSVREAGTYPLENGKSPFEAHMYGHLFWFYQQVVKLYAGKVLGLRDYVLLDSDIIWFREVPFIARIAGNYTAYYYATSRQYQAAYISSSRRIPGIASYKETDKSKNHRSGVVHHIVMSKPVLDHLFTDSSDCHDGRPFWQVLLNESAREMTCMPHRRGICGGGSTLSEYELYFNYARVKYPHTVVIRPLWWSNGPSPGLLFNPPSDQLVSDGKRDCWLGHRQADVDEAFDKQIAADLLQGYDYIAFHNYAKRRYTEIQWDDIDILCNNVPQPINSTCSWRGFEELVVKNRTASDYFQHCNCYMALNQQ